VFSTNLAWKNVDLTGFSCKTLSRDNKFPLFITNPGSAKTARVNMTRTNKNNMPLITAIQGFSCKNSKQTTKKITSGTRIKKKVMKTRPESFLSKYYLISIRFLQIFSLSS
jgi:hypothetical protein